MSQPALRIALRWIVGVAIGTALIALTSPLFVRSYVSQQIDSVRGVATLSPGHAYRWRSEGYATTHIGRHGMPGFRESVGISEQRQIAIWGDSQAEGMSVCDENKLSQQIDRFSHGVVSLPLARSGDEGSAWVAQMARVEQGLGADLHLLLITELVDLRTAAEPYVELTIDQLSTKSRIASWVPDFLVHAIRYLVNDTDGNRRRFRFSVGPIGKSKPSNPLPNRPFDWSRPIGAIAQAARRPVVIVYAPRVPRVAGARIRSDDPDADEFIVMKTAAASAGFKVFDLREAFAQAVERGDWPFGFHNGEIGQGHLNSTGYQIIAEQLKGVIESLLDDVRQLSFRSRMMPPFPAGEMARVVG